MSLKPARSTAERKTLASSAVKAARSVGSYDASMRPASMREKSSSVLTSLSRRSALRWASSRRSRSARATPGDRASSVLERAEHQRERRAELVADVAEEGGLGPVELGERLGAPALLLVGARVGDGGGDVAGDQIEEAPVVVVEHARGLTPATRKPGRPVLAASSNGTISVSVTSWPGPPGAVRTGSQIVNSRPAPSARVAGPGAVVASMSMLRGWPRCHTQAKSWPTSKACVPSIEQVQQDEQDIGEFFAKHPQRDGVMGLMVDGSGSAARECL